MGNWLTVDKMSPVWFLLVASWVQHCILLSTQYSACSAWCLSHGRPVSGKIEVGRLLVLLVADFIFTQQNISTGTLWKKEGEHLKSPVTVISHWDNIQPACIITPRPPPSSHPGFSRIGQIIYRLVATSSIVLWSCIIVKNHKKVDWSL